MIYCLLHERGLIPVGYRLRSRHVGPAQWHELSRQTLLLAGAFFRWGGCSLPDVSFARCDLCYQKEEKDATDTFSDRGSK